MEQFKSKMKTRSLKERHQWNFKLGKYQRLIKKELELRTKLDMESKCKFQERQDFQFIRSRCTCGRKMYKISQKNEPKNDSVDGTPKRCHHVSLNDQCMYRDTSGTQWKLKNSRPLSADDIHTPSSLRQYTAQEKAKIRREKLNSLEQDCRAAYKIIGKLQTVTVPKIIGKLQLVTVPQNRLLTA